MYIVILTVMVHFASPLKYCVPMSDWHCARHPDTMQKENRCTCLHETHKELIK